MTRRVSFDDGSACVSAGLRCTRGAVGERRGSKWRVACFWWEAPSQTCSSRDPFEMWIC